MTSKTPEIGTPKIMILDPFFMVLSILHISANTGKTVLRKIVYHENKNVPLPCHSASRFSTFLHPFFHTYLGPLGNPRGYPWETHFRPFLDPLGKGSKYLLRGRSKEFHSLLDGFGHFWVPWKTPKKGCF